MKRAIFICLTVIFLLTGNAFSQTEAVRRDFTEGLENARNGRFEKALKNFQDSLEKYQSSKEHSNIFAAKINFNIAVCLYRTNRFAEAAPYLEKAIELSQRKYAKAFHALGMTQIALGERAKAKDAFLTAARLDENDGENWFDLAMVYLDEAEFSQAAESFAQAIRHRSVDAPSALNNLGVIAAFKDDWQQAEHFFTKALTASGGKLPEAVRNLKICREQNLKEEAVAKLEFVSRELKAN